MPTYINVDTREMVQAIREVEDVHVLNKVQGQLAYIQQEIKNQIRKLVHESPDKTRPVGPFQVSRVPADSPESEK